jgi:hypothetical protein
MVYVESDDAASASGCDGLEPIVGAKLNWVWHGLGSLPKSKRSVKLRERWVGRQEVYTQDVGATNLDSTFLDIATTCSSDDMNTFIISAS